MNYPVIPATLSDMPEIFELFEQAIQYQKDNQYIGWNNYDQDFIKADIQHGLLYKIMDGTSVRCIFSVCYTDKLIWREYEKSDALYLHRIVLNRKFQGVKIFRIVLDWAVKQIRKQNLRFVRMDTWAGNSKLIDYYKSYGFRFVENYTTANTNDLPLQHRNLHVALLELEPDKFLKSEQL
jgi:ribosomal protein S18 acetylase RimI-like enzyme